MNKSANAITQLCPKCGLCCNGVIFGDVELQRGDRPHLYSQAGLELVPKGRKTAFAQPCACLVRGLCRIYANRPARCADFDCTLLKRVQAKKTTVFAALRKIDVATKQAAAVKKLVRQLGDHAESQPLNQRYAAIMEQPIDMTARKTDIKSRGRLMLAVSRLAKTLDRDFL